MSTQTRNANATTPKPPSVGGRAVSARNATTHGLFARDVILPTLGEDPAAFDALLGQLCDQLPPRNMLERHYLEQIAAASWRLRRLHRWQAQVYEDGTIDEDARLDKLDKTLRHETMLTRQIDRAVRLLGHDLSDLFAGRARDAALRDCDATEQDCKDDPRLAADIQRRVWQERDDAGADADLTGVCLDNTCPPPNVETDTEMGETQNCENEPPPQEEPDDLDHDVTYTHPDGRPVYLDAKAWHNQIYMRSHGDQERADEHADYFRQCFLNSQERRQAKKCKNEP